MISANDPVTPFFRVDRPQDNPPRRNLAPVATGPLAAAGGPRDHGGLGMNPKSGVRFWGTRSCPSQQEMRMSSMSEEADPSESRAAARNAAAGALPGRVTFNRFELNRILNLYGRMVADGEWRDYAIDFLRDRAVFSVFRRASEVPIYRIEKDPRLARKQGIYSVISASELILRRGHELDRVLLVIDRKLALV